MNPLITSLDQEYARLHERSCALLSKIRSEQLYQPPRADRPAFYPQDSCGEHLLRSAAAIEQTFGGITSNLWDDPFEWTLPETLSTPELVREYLSEVEATRRRGFDFLNGDGDLLKEIMMPPGELRSLFSLLLETLARASHHQGRAYSVFSLFSDERPPQLL